ncbi:MAG: transcription termination/antitermination protein NusA [Chloroflexi bacterium]|nr:transcription termination/antitermination protein NusA [Chloroflexota bacterium]
MKSEFLLAFNEICESRGLPKEVVIDALKVALVSAYRRSVNTGNMQAVTVEIDPRTGDPTIYAEKEVVDHVINESTEVTLEDAQRGGYPQAEMGDLVMADSTPRNFGRIAAQTAKQVILQRVREAERDQLYEDFSAREGEIVNGTVQSVSGQNITIGLGRTEAVLPKNQQVGGERYRPHDKIRVYVLEVKKTNRGPQIYVSRNHRNLLRRLLELEVPEIYNGQVDIKSIAREAGGRSKVAVKAVQPGVDPVGACVGMRGVRIQSIVRELNDEKIDVIEWDADAKNFIAKALSPARVAQVFLEEHPEQGKTASVIVPDDQLSLAIGREGQNARLAAKLTGWRIDIKSMAEAVQESLKNLNHSAVDQAVTKDKELLERIDQILAKKEANRPITAEDYIYMNRLVVGVEGRIVAARTASYDDLRQFRNEARKRVPAAAWKLPLDELDLPGRTHNLLLDNEIETVGDVLFNLELGDDVFLKMRSFGDKALEELKDAVTSYRKKLREMAPETVEEPVFEEEVPEASVPVVEEDLVAEPTPVLEVTEELVVSTEEEPQPEEEEEVEVFTAAIEALDKPKVPDLDDLSKSLVDAEPPVAPPATRPTKPTVTIVRPTPSPSDDRDDDSRKKQKKGKQLVFDENVGRTVVKRKRKSNRTQDWGDFNLEDFDEF